MSMTATTHLVLSIFRPGDPYLLFLLAVWVISVGLLGATLSSRFQSQSISSGGLFCGALFAVLLFDQLGLPFAQFVHYSLAISTLVFILIGLMHLYLPESTAKIFAKLAGSCLLLAVLMGLLRLHISQYGIIVESFGAFMLAALIFGFSLADLDASSNSENGLIRATTDSFCATAPAILLALFASRLVDFGILYPISVGAIALVFVIYLFVRIALPVPETWRRIFAVLVPAVVLALLAYDRSSMAWFGSGVLVILAAGEQLKAAAGND